MKAYEHDGGSLSVVFLIACLLIGWTRLTRAQRRRFRNEFVFAAEQVVLYCLATPPVVSKHLRKQRIELAPRRDRQGTSGRTTRE
jgi:hypothetical protein